MRFRSSVTLPVALPVVLAAACGTSSAPSSGTASSSSGASSSGSSSGTSSSSSSGGGTAVGASQHGIATYYAATGSGACGYDPSPNALNVAAMNASQWAGSAVCGECVRVTGPNGAVTVRIVDECPDCEAGQLDLSKEAFGQIAALSAGRVDIDWQVVACDVTGPIAYFYKDGSSQYWTAIQVRNSRLPIRSLEVQSSGGYTNIGRTDYDYFVADPGVGTGPVHVRVTAIDGQTLEDTLPPVQASLLTQGAAQFH